MTTRTNEITRLGRRFNRAQRTAKQIAEELRPLVVEEVRAGTSVPSVEQLSGVTRRTIYKWVRADAAGPD